jgi:hypothetical protein
MSTQKECKARLAKWDKGDGLGAHLLVSLSPMARTSRVLDMADELGKGDVGLARGNTQKSLLDLCRAFDAIDLSECNRRLEAGEKFDAACEATIEKRWALGQQIKERLGDEAGDFERRANDVSQEFPKLSQVAESVVMDMLHNTAHCVTQYIQLSDGPADVEMIRRYIRRLATLAGVE